MLQLDGGSRDRCGLQITTYMTPQLSSWVPYSERLERGDACWLLKLKQMGTRNIQMKGVLPWSVCWAHCAVTRYVCQAALVSIKYIFLTVHYFNKFVPIVQQAGQAVVPGCLSLNVCLWPYYTAKCKSCSVKQLFRNPASCSSSDNTYFCQFSNSLTTSLFSGCKGYNTAR